MASAGELNRLAESRSPNVQTRSISDTFARRTRAKSSSASATARARSRSVAVSIAILRAKLSSCFANAGLVPMPTLKPCRYALRLARCLPAQDRGPRALACIPSVRRDLSLASQAHATDFSRELSSTRRTSSPSIMRSEASRSCRPKPSRYWPMQRRDLLRRDSNELSSLSIDSSSDKDRLIASASIANSSSPNCSSSPDTFFSPLDR
jgi:hypothetical protein